MTGIRRACLATMALAAPAAPAVATDGNLYPFGSSVSAAGAQFSASQAGETWTIAAPALAAASVGSKWEMNWGCPVGGSEIAVVRWSALRTAAPSSLEQHVSSFGAVFWAEADAGHAPVARGRRPVRRRPAARRLQRPPQAGPDRAAGPARPGLLHRPPGHPRARPHRADRDDPRGHRRLAPGRGQPGAGRLVRRRQLRRRRHGTARPLHRRARQVGRRARPGRLRRRPRPGRRPRRGAERPPRRARGRDADGLGRRVHRGRPHAADRGRPRAHVRRRAGAGELRLDAARRHQRRRLEPGPRRARRGRRRERGSGCPFSPAAATRCRAPRPTSRASRTASTRGGWWWPTAPATRAWSRGRARWWSTPSLPRSTSRRSRPPTSRRCPVDLVARDNLQGTLGLGYTEIDLDTAANGRPDGAWLRLATEARAPGRQVFTLPLPGLPDGTHRVRVRVRNGGALRRHPVHGAHRADQGRPDEPRHLGGELRDHRPGRPAGDVHGQRQALRRRDGDGSVGPRWKLGDPREHAGRGRGPQPRRRHPRRPQRPPALPSPGQGRRRQRGRRDRAGEPVGRPRGPGRLGAGAAERPGWLAALLDPGRPGRRLRRLRHLDPGRRPGHRGRLAGDRDRAPHGAGLSPCSCRSTAWRPAPTASASWPATRRAAAPRPRSAAS